MFVLLECPAWLAKKNLTHRRQSKHLSLRLKTHPAKGICGICVTLCRPSFLGYFSLGVQVLMLIPYLKSAHPYAECLSTDLQGPSTLTGREGRRHICKNVGEYIHQVNCRHVFKRKLNSLIVNFLWKVKSSCPFVIFLKWPTSLSLLFPSVADPGCYPWSRIWIFSIPDPGSRGQKSNGFRIRNTAFFNEMNYSAPCNASKG